jgi:hypothetical protein
MWLVVIGGESGGVVEHRRMCREPSRVSGPGASAAPVACVACGSDAFALGAAVAPSGVGGVVEVELRCGACGRWQRRQLSLAVADRFLDHMALTQATIARALTPA